MRQRATWIALVVMLLLACVAVQAQEQYLDVFVAQVKPDKRADFDAINKKIVAANRQNKGDEWLAMETVYGPMNQVTFVSMRDSYDGAEKAGNSFYASIVKSIGKSAADKLFQDFNATLVSSRSEFRRRRWDLGSNAPSDAAAMAKMLGESRWLRTSIVHVRPGQGPAFEDLLKEVKAAREKNSPDVITLVSQSVAGQEGTRYYVTQIAKSMAGFDSIPTLKKVMGDEGFAHYLKSASEMVEGGETVINRFVPEISNPPADVVAAAPDYWTPKAVVAKAAPAKKSVVNAAQTTKDEKK